MPGTFLLLRRAAQAHKNFIGTCHQPSTVDHQQLTMANTSHQSPSAAKQGDVMSSYNWPLNDYHQQTMTVTSLASSSTDIHRSSAAN